MPNMSQYLKEDFPKNISINVGASYSFKNYEKIKEWCKLEVEFYTSIGENNIGSIFNQVITNPLSIRFNQNRNVEISWDDFSKELKEFISSTYKRQGFIASRSKEGKFLERLNKTNPKIVPGALLYFQQKTQPRSGAQINQDTQRNGQFAAYLFDNNIEPDFEEEKRKYEDFYSEIIAQKDKLLEELKNAKDENNSINKELNNLKTAIAKKFDEEFDRHKIKMEEAEKFYKSELAVKEAVTYWTQKAKNHRIYSIVFGITSGLVMITTFISIICFGKYIIGLNLDAPDGVGKKLLTQSGALQIWVYAVFLGALTLIVWIIRLLVKIFLSNLHLLSDAKERETMIMTYLAFEREEQVLSKEDKDLILPSIFRVSSNGIIKEDSSPNPIMNIVTKNIGE
ncbi:DUF6161 domain-containing protein [Sinomicrobium weinanense]|uniref:DUF6161 domain-containing protein n=1 Tax=Sinomicrobium weinanense TaxID=2842200 RepID=A0A926Q3S2_9FLAO|nr:DUF6161 domain-containing protein [Sinomicrobium weinanense]MBC9797858.1 hypothetical protein [Sinomicrobium weinanense]MBU3122242.1 hypothetical protein [Sinomicrobium weinanense]